MEPTPQTQRPTENEVESLRQALAQEKAKVEEHFNGWQRAQADFQNLKRRTEEEKEEARRFANAMFILNLLPVVDDFERAFNSLSAPLAGLTWVDGIRLIYRKLQAVLEAHGVAQIQAGGKPFDPDFHEAVSYAPGGEGIVLEEVQRGYTLHGRTIRPSLVIVGKGEGQEAGGAREAPQEAKDG